MERDLHLLHSGKFDLLVVGGGIYGAWIAWESSLRGLKTAIIEQEDWASGTSQASSKLIHGGLRYLRYGHFTLVRKALAERHQLMAAAPHRIQALRFFAPVTRDGAWSKWQMALALKTYELLTPHRDQESRHLETDGYCTGSGLREKYPFIAPEVCSGGYHYWDMQTDDARYTLEIVDGAVESGCAAANYLRAKSWIRMSDRVQGALVEDVESGATFDLQASLTVFAGGAFPWPSLENLPTRNIQPRKIRGVHLVLPALPSPNAILLTHPDDSRVLFMIPWYGKTLLGTTESDLTATDSAALVTEEESAYLLRAANHLFGESRWCLDDIAGSFAGIRVLKDHRISNPNALSREWHLLELAQGLYFSLGGKFTTARLDAVTTVNTLERILRGKVSSPRVLSRKFPWCPASAYPGFLERSIQVLNALGVPADSARHLAMRYGNRLPRLQQVLLENPRYCEPMVLGLPFCKGEAVYAARFEMARRLRDIFRRRIPLEILCPEFPRELQELGLPISGSLGWTADKLQKEWDDLEARPPMPGA